MKRLPKFVPSLLLILLLASCTTTATPAQHDAPLSTVTLDSAKPFVNAHALIIIRHADIDPAQKAIQGTATPLLPAGEARAKELLPALKDAGITRIITSAALRTQATADPLAQALHLTPENPFAHNAEGPALSAGTTEAQTVYRYLAQTAKPTDTLLLVHHHSVIPSLLAEFGFPHEPPILDASEFDRVYILLPDPEHHTYHLLRLRYNGKW